MDQASQGARAEKDRRRFRSLTSRISGALILSAPSLPYPLTDGESPQKVLARVTNPRDRSDHHHSCCETTSRFSPRCILSRQPARTSLRFAATAALRFAPPGVRSGTLPTVGVAKGKIAKCRVSAPFADFKNSWTPGPLITAVKVESILYTGSFPLHFDHRFSGPT